MNFLQTFELGISTLSPIHIGCGEDYEPTNYIVDSKGVLHRFDTDLLAIHMPQTFQKELIETIENLQAGEQLTAIAKLLRKHRDVIIPHANIQVPLSSGVMKHYNATQNPKHDFNKNGIERSSYNPLNQRLYIPGSSIKGAIRTALLDNDTQPLSTKLLADIEKFNRMIEEVIIKNTKQLRLKPQHSKTDYNDARKQLEKTIKQEAIKLEQDRLGGSFETDPLRALKISDAHCCEPLTRRRVAFCINRSRRGHKSQAESKGLYTRLEYLNAFQPDILQISATYQNLQTIAGQQNHKGKALAPNSSHLLDKQHLWRHVNQYYLPKLHQDLALLQKIKPDSAWLRQIKTILAAGLEDDITNNHVLLLKIGKHSGADSNTVNGRKIKIMLNEDCRTQRGKTEKIRLYVFNNEPRTTWFCADEMASPEDLSPYGWIVISPMNTTWSKEMDGYQYFVTRREQQQKAEQKKVEEQAAAQAEKERLAKKASLSPAMQEIEELIHNITKRIAQLRGDKEKPHQALHTQAKQLVDQALTDPGWQPDEKQQLAEAIRHWLPQIVSGLDKKQLKKMKLNELQHA